VLFAYLKRAQLGVRIPGFSVEQDGFVCMLGVWNRVEVCVSDEKCVKMQWRGVEEDFDDDSRDIRSNQAGEYRCAVIFHVRRCGIRSVLIELLDCRITAALGMSSSLVSVATSLSSLLSCGAAFLGMYMLSKALHGLRPCALLLVGLASRVLLHGASRRHLLGPLG
jgi:hypothetical protein